MWAGLRLFTLSLALIQLKPSDSSLKLPFQIVYTLCGVTSVWRWIYVQPSCRKNNSFWFLFAGRAEKKNHMTSHLSYDIDEPQTRGMTGAPCKTLCWFLPGWPIWALGHEFRPIEQMLWLEKELLKHGTLGSPGCCGGRMFAAGWVRSVVLRVFLCCWKIFPCSKTLSFFLTMLLFIWARRRSRFARFFQMFCLCLYCVVYVSECVKSAPIYSLSSPCSYTLKSPFLLLVKAECQLSEETFLRLLKNQLNELKKMLLSLVTVYSH